MRIYLSILAFLLCSISTAKANNVNILINIDAVFNCKFEKIILKNNEYNYETFFAKEDDKKDLKNLKINSIKPDYLEIKGLSEFLSTSSGLEVKVVNNGVILFKAFNPERDYSESAILTRKSGELIHEITKNIKSENPEKNISFYSCIQSSQST